MDFLGTTGQIPRRWTAVAGPYKKKKGPRSVGKTAATMDHSGLLAESTANPVGGGVYTVPSGRSMPQQPQVVLAEGAPPAATTRTTARFPDWATMRATQAQVGVVHMNAEPETSESLMGAIAREGQIIAASAAQSMDAMNSNLSYESLVQGFMTTGESVTTFMIDYGSLKMWEYGRKDKTEKMLPAGKALITSQRLLLLSCQPTAHTHITREGDTPHLGRNHGHYDLLYKAANTVSYQPIPLTCFRSLSLSMETAAHGQGVVQKNAPEINNGCCTRRSASSSWLLRAHLSAASRARGE